MNCAHVQMAGPDWQRLSLALHPDPAAPQEVVGAQIEPGGGVGGFDAVPVRRRGRR
ncbi:MAG: hypothetical protein R3A10_00490 [Caldilineaceae bacterium]